jgi:hypothetical protein
MHCSSDTMDHEDVQRPGQELLMSTPRDSQVAQEEQGGRGTARLDQIIHQASYGLMSNARH